MLKPKKERRKQRNQFTCFAANHKKLLEASNRQFLLEFSFTHGALREGHSEFRSFLLLFVLTCLEGHGIILASQKQKTKILIVCKNFGLSLNVRIVEKGNRFSIYPKYSYSIGYPKEVNEHFENFFKLRGCV
jgi:transcription elongation factor Elf1